MAMEDWKSVFSRIFWKNKRAGGTPLNEVNLNIGDIAMQEFDNRILELRDAKFGRAEANGLIKDWKIDEKTGIITVTWLNGTTKIYDLNIEKIPVNFEMSDEGIITMTTDDGTKFKTDIKKAIPIYTFKGSATINVTPSIGESGDKVYTFEIVDGSIDGTKLDPDYLAQINTSVGNASNYAESGQTSATAAATSELNAKKSEINAKASETAAMTSETNAQASETAAASSASTASTKASEASTSATNAANSANSASASASTAASKASSASASATTATTKANEASASATSAATSATNAKTSETNAQAYAIGATNSAKYYYEQSKTISESFSGALRPMGTVAFASLPTLASASEGDMYNVSNQFTTTADFKEGSGFIIPAGANVYKTSDGKWDILAGTPVTGVKGNKETTYRRGNVNITPANIGALAEDGNTNNNTVSFTSADSTSPTGWTDVNTLESGEKHSSLFNKISTMFKNIRWLYKMLGTTDISGIGNGTVTGGLSALNSNLGKVVPIPNFSELTALVGGTQTTSELKYITPSDSWYLMDLQTNDDTGCDIAIQVNGISVSEDYSIRAWHKITSVLYLKKNTEIKFFVSNNVNISCFVARFK